jgi:hypothetical protein
MRLLPLPLALAALAGLLLAYPLAADGRAQQMNLRVTVALVPGSGSSLHYRGTFTGPPFGSGKTDVTTTIRGTGTAHISFTLSTKRGSVSGSGDVTVKYRGSSLICNGPARLTSGTGAYASFRANALRISGTTAADAVKTTLKLSGPYTS